MKYAAVLDDLAGLGGAKWGVHIRARALKAAGRQVLELTIGEPDTPPPARLLDVAAKALTSGRTGYSNGRGEAGLLQALADRYSLRHGRGFETDQFLCLPGTQTVLYMVLRALAENGAEVLVGDPMYATYEGVIRASGASMVPVPLRAEHGFRMQAADVEARITKRSRVLFLNTPHNPTGAVLRDADIAALGAVARAHDLWILTDEVYEELVFDGTRFVSPLSHPGLADRVIAASSISKSHAAPGFRSGWCVGPAEFISRALPLAETMLFGNQPFLADATADAISAPSPVARGMAARYAARAQMLWESLDGVAGLRVHRPDAGMFALLDVRASGMTGEGFALALLEAEGVACMPGESFGDGLAGWLRISLTQPDAVIGEAAARIARFARQGA
ncbi:MAG: pyridoxal phosphate-dependent aminotransferase [Pseudotabrizicola sp.]|uniref:pyridoxal phosphate-dependent aminotransferase n=1 Tax=Pseudotabrizicola sp. TaxID=2939647 RepID=UPI00271601A6|nr:pyridoxal phosphate-dependent aminotransferase [Pseudotabrizicola sp.]MDO9640247.1 pyridoxal phosphate-dependent aminotransferase [Pseudotabrizicola sp.]